MQEISLMNKNIHWFTKNGCKKEGHQEHFCFQPFGQSESTPKIRKLVSIKQILKKRR